MKNSHRALLVCAAALAAFALPAHAQNVVTAHRLSAALRRAIQ